jgi:hypothetical protein
MKRFWRWSLLLAAVLLLLSLILVSIGCGDGGGGGGASAEALAMMKKVPKSAGDFTYMDLKALRTDGDLKDLYESATEELSDSEDAGIPTDNVDRVVQAGYLTMLEGRFSLESLESHLEDSGYQESDHGGIAIWVGPSSSVALVSESCLVTGWDTEELEGCVDVISGEGDSLYDDADIRELTDRLPGGFALTVYTWDEEFDELYEGVRAIGYSLAKKSSDKARMTIVFAFPDAASAGEAEEEVEQLLTYEDGEGGLSNIQVTRDGKYVKATGQMSIKDALD